MKSCVITIYRDADAVHPEALVGTFADPTSGHEQPFTTLGELHALLDSAATAPRQHPKITHCRSR